jgi:hypothetical protein
MHGKMLRYVTLIGVALGFGACSDTIIRDGKIGSTSALYTTADIRIITERPNPTQPGHTVICTEPSPDVAKALSTASQLSGKAASGPEVALNFASAEALAELAGRTALRDELYKTCEAYANGAIGDLAYLPVLNRYGELMATLFLGQDVQGSAVAASIQSPTLSLGGGSQGGSGTKTSDQQGSPTPSAPAGPAADSTGIADHVQIASGSNLVRLADWVPQSKQVVPGAASSRAPSPAASDKSKQPSSPQSPGTAPEQKPSAGTTVSADLTQMQKQYLALDSPQELLHLMTIACLEEFDSTRLGAARPNFLLQQSCPAFIAALATTLPRLASSGGSGK